MRKIFVGLAMLTWGVLSAAPQLTSNKNELILSNAGAIYRIGLGGTYPLKNSSFNGQKIWPENFKISYHIYPEDHWFSEVQPSPKWSSGQWSHHVLRSGTALTIQARTTGPAFSHLKEYTLRGDSPDLVIRQKLVFTGPNDLHWVCNSSPFPFDKVWLRFVGQIHNGKIVNTLKRFNGCPFKPAKNGEFGWTHQWQHLSAIGSYDPDTDTGALLLVAPEKPWPIRVGTVGNLKKRTHRAFVGFSSYNFSDYGNQQSGVDFEFIIHPFQGTPERLNANYLRTFREKMEKLQLFPTKQATGKLLTGDAQSPVAVWSDYPSATVYPSEPMPEVRRNWLFFRPAPEIELAAGQAEFAMTQLVVRLNQKPSQVALKLSPLRRNGKISGWGEWGAVQFYDGSQLNRAGQLSGRRITQVTGSDPGIVGKVPDIVLTNRTVTVAPHQAQPFLVRYKVSPQTPPGIYTGTLQVLVDDRAVSTVAVKLKVWNFSLARRTLTAALDFWPRYQAHPNGGYRAMFDQTEKLLVEAGGGERWVGRWGGAGGWPWSGIPTPKFDAAGNLLSVDYRKFDELAEKAFQVYRHQIIIPKFFMLGAGHRPTHTSFGKKSATLTPRWQKMFTQMYRNFHQHLRKKNWQDKVVIDLFDEPHPRYNHILKRTIELMRQVNPQVRSTYAGAFSPSLNGYINFWNLPMGGNYTSRYNLNRIRERGGEVSVYNPVGYDNNALLTQCRGGYTWLWRENISYVYQWVVNDWSELTGGKDTNRVASWVFPVGDTVYPTLRLANTTLGIQDYEYYQKLRQEKKRLGTKAPELAARAARLLAQTEQLAWRSPEDERSVIVSNDPARFDQLHRAIGELLDEMSRR